MIQLLIDQAKQNNMSVQGYPTDPIFSADPKPFYSFFIYENESESKNLTSSFNFQKSIAYMFVLLKSYRRSTIIFNKDTRYPIKRFLDFDTKMKCVQQYRIKDGTSQGKNRIKRKYLPTLFFFYNVTLNRHIILFGLMHKNSSSVKKKREMVRQGLHL